MRTARKKANGSIKAFHQIKSLSPHHNNGFHLNDDAEIPLAPRHSDRDDSPSQDDSSKFVARQLYSLTKLFVELHEAVELDRDASKRAQEDFRNELSELKRCMEESNDVLDSRVSSTSRTLIERQQHYLEKHELVADHVVDSEKSLESVKSEVASLNVLLREIFSNLNTEINRSETLSKIHSEYSEQISLISDRLFRSLEETKNSTAFSPQVLDERMSQYEQQLHERTTHWRFHENIFYGIVMLLLLLNTGILVWSQFSYP